MKTCFSHSSTAAPVLRSSVMRLPPLADLPETDIEQRKVVWLARAYSAETLCQGPRREQARGLLAGLDATLREALPEGGAIVRHIDGIRDACFAAATPAAAVHPAPATPASVRSAPRRARSS